MTSGFDPRSSSPDRRVCVFAGCALTCCLLTGSALAQQAPDALHGLTESSAALDPGGTASILPAPARSRRITLREALEQARRHAPTVLAAAAQASSASASVSLARAPLLPTFGAQLAGQGYRLQAPSDLAAIYPGAGTGDTTQTRWLLEGSIQGRWTIWDFGRTSLSVRAAEAVARVNVDNVSVVERAAVEQAAGAFFAVLADQQMVDVQRQTLAMRRRELEIASGLVAAGIRDQIERVRAQLTVNAAELALTGAELARRGDAMALAAAPSVTTPATRVGSASM
ncbi:MAG: TolC family protein, partial [Deltaproteobacteria bacterium]